MATNQAKPPCIPPLCRRCFERDRITWVRITNEGPDGRREWLAWCDRCTGWAEFLQSEPGRYFPDFDDTPLQMEEFARQRERRQANAVQRG